MGTEGSGISGAAAAVSSTEEASPCGPMELELGTAESSDEAEDKELQKQAAALTKAARKSVREAAVDVRKAEAALRHEQRREEEREKRWWAAERRDAPPPAYLQLDRACIQVAGEGPPGASAALRGAQARGGSEGGAWRVHADRERPQTHSCLCVNTCIVCGEVDCTRLGAYLGCT